MACNIYSTRDENIYIVCTCKAVNLANTENSVKKEAGRPGSYAAQSILIHHQVPEEVLNGVDAKVSELLVENAVFPNLLQTPYIVS